MTQTNPRWHARPPEISTWNATWTHRPEAAVRPRLSAHPAGPARARPARRPFRHHFLRPQLHFLAHSHHSHSCNLLIICAIAIAFAHETQASLETPSVTSLSGCLLFFFFFFWESNVENPLQIELSVALAPARPQYVCHFCFLCNKLVVHLPSRNQLSVLV